MLAQGSASNSPSKFFRRHESSENGLRRVSTSILHTLLFRQLRSCSVQLSDVRGEHYNRSFEQSDLGRRHSRCVPLDAHPVRSNESLKPLTWFINDPIQGLKSQFSHYYLGNLAHRALSCLMNPDDVSQLGSFLITKEIKKTDKWQQNT